MKTRKAFSLPELLVVIAIIAILMGLLLSGVQKARESANKTKCLNGLRQTGIGINLYHDVYAAFPLHDPTQRGKLLPAMLLSFIEEAAQDIDNPQPIPIFTCASRGRADLVRFDWACYPNFTLSSSTHRSILAGRYNDNGTLLPSASPVTLTMVTQEIRGTSYSMLLSHKSLNSKNYLGWDRSADCEWNMTFTAFPADDGARNYMRELTTGTILEKDHSGVDLTKAGFGSPHEGGVPCLMADNSVRVFQYRWASGVNNAKHFIYQFTFNYNIFIGKFDY